MSERAGRRSRILALVLTLVCVGCGGGRVVDPIDAECPQGGSSYTIEFVETTGGGTRATSQGLESTDFTGGWDPDLGALYLGADNTKEPLGTLTVELAGHVAGPQNAQVVKALLSTTDVRVEDEAETVTAVVTFLVKH